MKKNLMKFTFVQVKKTHIGNYVWAGRVTANRVVGGRFYLGRRLVADITKNAECVVFEGHPTVESFRAIGVLNPIKYKADAIKVMKNFIRANNFSELQASRMAA